MSDRRTSKINIDFKNGPNNKRGSFRGLFEMKSFKGLVKKPEKNVEPVGQMDHELKSQLVKRELEATYNLAYDAKFCIAVIGSENSGKEDILNKELFNESAILGEQPNASKIKIFTKRYMIKEKCIHVEFWSCPEEVTWMKYCSRLVSGLAGTIIFFDGIRN